METEPRLQAAFLAACAAELAALKPGNVHRFGAGHGMTVADFEASAAAAAPCIASRGSGIGARILAATEATWAAVGCNTNLGILLLCAPLAQAAERVIESGAGVDQRGLAAATRVALAGLGVADTALAYRAIRLANPAGLGSATTQDVHAVPSVTLRQAMELAAERDRIAYQYASDFADIFTFALPCLRTALAAGNTLEQATSTLFLALLARWNDSHLVRKFGDSVGQSVSAEARSFAELCTGMPWPQAFEHLLAWDKRLKAQGFNPGTSADLSVATLFVHHLLDA